MIRLLFATTTAVSPLSIAAHPEGKTIIGGILGGWLAVELVKRKMGVHNSTGDLFALALPLGEAIGRIGCFLNGCCYGAPCDLPWAIQQHGALRHPAQIYSMVTALAIFVFLWCMRNRKKREGDLFRWYLILWSGSRFLLEFVRERSEIHFGLSLAQWVSIEVAISVALAMALSHFFLKKRGTVQHD